MPSIYHLTARLTVVRYSVFEYTYLLFWNVFWSLAPVIAIGLFDRVIGMFVLQLCANSHSSFPLDDDILMILPELYKYGREGRYFGIKLFSYFMLEGIFQVCFVTRFDLCITEVLNPNSPLSSSSSSTSHTT